MTKTLKAILCLSLAVLMGIAAPILAVTMSKNATADALPEGIEAAYLPKEEDDFSGAAELPDTMNIGIDEVVGRSSALAYSAGGNKTYVYSDVEFIKTVPDKKVSDKNCSAMQGMNVGTTYAYTAKIHKDNGYATVTRTDLNSKSQVVMSYYSSLSAKSASSCNTLGHANDLTVVTNTENGKSVNYMYVAVCVDGMPSVARLKIDGTKLYFTGYFNTVKTNGTKMNVSAIRGVRHAGGYQYFLVKAGMSFYTFRVAEGAKGGSKSSPTKVTAYKMFTIDTRNALFASSNSAYGTIDNLETWINQGFGYTSDQKAIYVPVFNGKDDNAILVYDVAKYVTAAKLDANKNCGSNEILYPSTLNFRIKKSSKLFEIESCGFRTGQGTNGDLYLYFNTNSYSSATEGIFRIKYKRTASLPAPAVNASNTVYTVKYDGNGGAEPKDTEGRLKMGATRHVKGISTRLRPNTFVKSDNDFIGWHLTRKSDGKWLYFTADGSAKWYDKGSQPVGARLALYENKRKVSALTAENGDVVTCYAQWRPTSTGTKSYYIRYDANGGKGSMADTKVVYGTSTAIRSNTYTRDGYTFGGWHAYRMSDNSWIYVNNSTGADKWIPVGESTAGYTLKVYRNACNVAKTSATDRDIVTFYATWTPAK